MTPNEQLDGAERAAYVVGRRADRVSFRQIGTELGVSPQRVHAIWSRTLRELPAPRLDEHRNEEAEMYDTAVRELLAIARDPQVPPRTRVEAWSVIRGWCERRARLWGLDAPARQRVTMLTEDMVDDAIRQLTEEIAEVVADEPAEG